jgi:hypothetical protein
MADDDEPDERPVRKRRARDEEDEEDKAPPRRRAASKKSGGGVVVLAVVAVLLLLCGGAVAGTIWAVKSLLNKASDELAQLTSKVDPSAETSAETKPSEKPSDGEKPANRPADNGLDVHFVPSEFAAAAVINGRVVKSPVVRAALPEEVITLASQDLGIDPLKVERAVVLAEPTPGGNVAFFPGGIIRFREPVDGKAVLGKVLKESQEASADGKWYLHSKTETMAGVPIAGHVADDKTILLAPEPTLKKMLAAKGDGPLARQLRQVDLNSDVAAVFVMEPVRELAKEAAKEARGELPPDFAEVATLPDRVKAAVLALNLSGEPLLKLTVEAENAESADVLEKLLGQGKDLLKKSYPDLRKQLAPELPPELSKDVLEMLDKVPDGLLIGRAGTTLTVTLKSPGDLAALSKKAAPFLLDRGSPAAPAAEWKTFTSRECGFSASFPGEPKKSVKKQPGGDETAFDAQAAGGFIRYGVTCGEQPAALSPEQAKAYFDAVAAGFDRKSVKPQRDIELNGYPGRELVVEMNERGLKTVVTNRLYVVKNRRYHLMVVAVKSQEKEAEAQKFFDSFKLLEDAGPKPPNKPPVVPPQEAKPEPALPPKPLAKRTETGDSLKGEGKAVMDVTLTAVKLSHTTTLPCLTWADDKGSAFYALDASGLLRRVTYPALKEEWKQELGVKCGWLSLSAEGLLVTVMDGWEVWLIDPAKGEMKSRFAMPGLKRVASAPGSSVAVATTGIELYLLDLKKGTALKYDGPKPQFGRQDGPVLTPDGKYAFTTGGLGVLQMHRWSLAGGKLRLEESSEGIAQGAIHTLVTVSPDSKLVCYPSYVGGGGGKNYTLAVFKVEDLKKPAFVLDPGGTGIGFDPAGGYIYTQDLRLYDIGGKFIKEYSLSGRLPMIAGMRQILVHPAGSAFLLMTNGQFAIVEVPKK